MKAVLTLTHLLSVLFLGMIGGSLVTGNTTLLGWSIFLLVLDIIIGISLQRSLDEKARNDAWDNLSFEEKRASAHATLESIKQAMRDEGIDVDGEMEKFCDEYNREHGLGTYSRESVKCATRSPATNVLCDELVCVYTRLEANGGAMLTNNINGSDAGLFLLKVCKQMPHAPLPYTLARLCCISIENLDGALAIVYSFEYSPNSVCQNVFIFLVHTKDNWIRLFAVETDFGKFMLCEYADGKHLNYGFVELKNVLRRIKEILK